MKFIRYTEGYRFQLEAVFQIPTGLKPVEGMPGNRFVGMAPDGLLTIAAGYAWDGASGPAINTHTILRGSLVHDALYQLIRDGVLTADQRESADQMLRQLCLEDGMWPPRAWWVYMAVRQFGGLYMQLSKDEVLTAPNPPPEGIAQ